MRILIVHNFYQHRGGEDVVFEQEVDLLRETHIVETLTFQNKKNVSGFFQYLFYPWNFFAVHKTKKYLKTFKPDIVHFHNTHYAAGPAIIRTVQKHHVPVVVSLHNFRLLCPSATLFYQDHLFTDSLKHIFPWKAVRYKVFENSYIKTFIVALAYYIHDLLGTWRAVKCYMPLAEFSKKIFLSSKRKLKEEQFQVKPNFVETSCEKQVRERYYLYIGRISPEKGIVQLLQAFENKDKVLHIAGDGPLAAALRNRTSKQANIHWLGELPKEVVAEELARCRALIVPSVCYEGGVPLTIMEAMSSQTPVLASDIGAIPDVIIHEQTGWLFNPYHPQSIQTAMESFENSNKKHEIVDTAHRLYQQYFTKRHVIDILNSTYLNILQKNEQYYCYRSLRIGS